MDLDGPIGDSLSYSTTGWIALKFNGNRDILRRNASRSGQLPPSRLRPTHLSPRPYMPAN